MSTDGKLAHTMRATTPPSGTARQARGSRISRSIAHSRPGAKAATELWGQFIQPTMNPENPKAIAPVRADNRCSSWARRNPNASPIATSTRIAATSPGAYQSGVTRYGSWKTGAPAFIVG